MKNPVKKSASQHTPGPWRIDPVNDKAGELVYAKIRGAVGPNGPVVGFAGVYHSEGRLHQEVAEANARLIAAAPELLAAAQSAANIIDATFENEGDKPPYYDTFRAVIAKATGEK